MTDIERRLARGDARALDAARLSEELARRALDAGLVDVAYGAMDSPVGELLVAVTDRGLVRVSFADELSDEVLAELAARVSPRVLRLPARTDAARRELDEYFAGERRRFDLALDWSLVRGFAQGVLRATARGAIRLRHDLPPDGGGGGIAAGLAGGRQRAGLEPHPDRGALPPRASLRRRPGRLRRRPGPQALPALAGGLAPRQMRAAEGLHDLGRHA